jgi:hypothetical protein
MKRLTLHRLASSLHRFTTVNTICVNAEIAKKQCKTVQHICQSKDDNDFWLCYENYEKYRIFGEIATGIHRFIASIR